MSAAGITLKIAGVAVERYGSLGSMDPLGALLFGDGALRRDRASLLGVFDRLGITQHVASWLPRWPGVMDAVGVGGILLPDADIAWVDDAHIPGLLAYAGRESLGGWQPTFSFIDVSAWALVLGLGDKKILEQLVRLTFWRTLLERPPQAPNGPSQEGAELNPGESALAPADIPSQTASIERLKAALREVLIALCKKVLSAIDLAPPGILEAGSISAYRNSAGVLLDGFGARVEVDEALLKQSTELRVQQWLPKLPPSLVEGPQVLQTLPLLRRYEQRLTVAALGKLMEALGVLTSPGLWGPELGRVLKVDGGSHRLAPLIDWLEQRSISLAGPWRAVLWRSPVDGSRLLEDTPQGALLLLGVARHALSGPHLLDPGDWLSVAVSSAWRMVEAGKPVLGFAALRSLCDTSTPTRPLVQALRVLLSATYGRSQALDLSQVPFMLPPFDSTDPPTTAQDTQNLARIFHDALLASLLEPQAGSPEEANRLFTAHIQQGLLYVERDPSEPATQRGPRRRARNPNRPPLAALVALLVVLVLVIVLVGWLLLTFGPRR